MCEIKCHFAEVACPCFFCSGAFLYNSVWEALETAPTLAPSSFLDIMCKLYEMLTYPHPSPLGLITDKEVRVSVKALAVSCVGAAAALHPEAFFNSLYLEPLDGVPVEGTGSNSMNKGVIYEKYSAEKCKLVASSWFIV